MKKTKLSIITICYNDPDIQKTCESIVSQQYQGFEWIVIDGGSGEETIDALNQYKDRIDIFVSEKDNGIYHAMNKGIGLASGEYLHFLNAGDSYFDKKTLEKAVEFLNNEDIIFGDMKLVHGKKSSIKKYPDKITYGWFTYETLPHPASFVKKDLFDKYGLYNEGHKIVSDWEKWIEFIEIHKCSYRHIPLVLSVFNCNGISAVYDELHLQERSDVMAKYYPGVEPASKKHIKILKIPVIKVIKKFDKTIYYLFGFLPVFKKSKKIE